MITSETQLTQGNIKYTWVGCSYELLVSYEKGVKAGDVRYIKGFYLYAKCIYPQGLFKANKVAWAACIYGSITNELDGVEKFRKALGIGL